MSNNSHFYKELNRDANFLLIGLIFSLSCIGYFIFTPAVPTERICGKVLSHNILHKTTKHGGKSTYYLNVDFGSKYYNPIEVKKSEYFKIADGARYCYDMPVESSGAHKIFYTLGFIFLVIAIIIAVANILF